MPGVVCMVSQIMTSVEPFDLGFGVWFANQLGAGSFNTDRDFGARFAHHLT